MLKVNFLLFHSFSGKDTFQHIVWNAYKSVDSTQGATKEIECLFMYGNNWANLYFKLLCMSLIV